MVEERTADPDAIAALARTLANADTVVALTGAGVSTASGIPDFRGDHGIWERFDPMDFRIDRFRADPAGFWADRLELHEAMYGGDGVEPNAAHEALADLAAVGQLDALITQNTDGLHTDAGTEAELIEIHGNASRVVCTACGRRADTETAQARATDGALPPRCPDCEGPFKPDVVLFGEQLDSSDLRRARQLAADADLFLAIGSSLTVEPVASLPRIATERGGTLAVVNLETTPHSGRAEYDLRADVTDALPRLYRAVTDR
ncbi:MAG: Sir2 family NAD-dependent protein deacetylase [Halobacteriales archaeon]|nr:Sir2 family NAD-dependent protein deacetylase [Halobacteriales archaeon]